MYLPFVNQKGANVARLMKKLALMVCCCFWIGALSAQPTIQWQKTYGGSSYDGARSIHQTTDGGFIMAGTTLSMDGDILGNHGGDDVWVVKLTTTGSIQWKKAIGGTNNDGAYSISPTHDGGYFVAGYTASNNFDISGNHGGLSDGLVVKLSSTGSIEWQKSIGGSGQDQIWSAQQTSDLGYILAGRSNSVDGDLSSNNGLLDFWVIKLNELGAIQWQKSLGGSKDDMARSVKQTLDGGYIIVGQTASTDGDVTGLHGNMDFWVVKLSPSGAMEWQKALGGTAGDIANDVIETIDGNYIVVGYVGSHNSGDVTGHAELALFDFWTVKLNNSGELVWQKTAGGTLPDYARSVVPAVGGGYLIAGTAYSNDGDIQGNHGKEDFWIIKIDEQGELVWQQPYGGTKEDNCFAICLTDDNGFALAGYSLSTNGDLSGSLNRGEYDFWVLKLSPEPSTPTNTPLTTQITLYPNPAHNAITLQTPSASTTLNVTIYDLLGRTLLREEIPNGGQLNIAALQKGVYFVSAEDGDGTVFRGKLEKE